MIYLPMSVVVAGPSTTATAMRAGLRWALMSRVAHCSNRLGRVGCASSPGRAIPQVQIGGTQPTIPSFDGADMRAPGIWYIALSRRRRGFESRTGRQAISRGYGKQAAGSWGVWPVYQEPYQESGL